MLNLDNIVSNKSKSSSENDDWPFRMLIIGPSGSGKTNALLHLIDKFHLIIYNYIYKIYLYIYKYIFIFIKYIYTPKILMKISINI